MNSVWSVVVCPSKYEYEIKTAAIVKYGLLFVFYCFVFVCDTFTDTFSA